VQIHPKVKQVAQYVVDRAKEPSTWAGVSSVAVFTHVHLDGQQVVGLTALGVGIASVLAVVMKES